MYVVGIGNVTQCNFSWIFTNDGGAQDRIAASEERLKDILRQATEDENFYERMRKEIRAEYERRAEEVKEKYKFITDDDVKAAYGAGRAEGWGLSIKKNSHNEECTRQRAYVYGLHDGVVMAEERRNEAHKLKIQAASALKK